jgi:hypothetical protein
MRCSGEWADVSTNSCGGAVARTSAEVTVSGPFADPCGVEARASVKLPSHEDLLVERGVA